jgi:formate dehydrogenase subunit gamma
MFHYLLVLSFLPLAVTGIFLFLKPYGEDTMNLLMRIHISAGVVLTMSVASFFVLALDRVVLFTKRAFTFGMNDVKWFAVLGGYPQKFLLRKKVPVPPMGKYNSGQKLFGACILIGGILLIGTGLALWAFPHIIPTGLAKTFGDIHLIAGLFLSLFLLVHIFLGIYMFHDFKAMFLHGKIPYEEAQEVAPLWVQEDIVPISERS